MPTPAPSVRTPPRAKQEREYGMVRCNFDHFLAKISIHLTRQHTERVGKQELRLDFLSLHYKFQSLLLLLRDGWPTVWHLPAISRARISEIGPPVGHLGGIPYLCTVRLHSTPEGAFTFCHIWQIKPCGTRHRTDNCRTSRTKTSTCQSTN